MQNPADILAQAKLKQEKLLKELAAGAISEVLGVVYALGAGGGKVGAEELWNFKTTFEAWRISGGQLQTRPLMIRRKVTNAELKRPMQLIKPYEVVRIQARVIHDSPFGGPEAFLEEFRRVDDSDAELNEFTKKLQEPVTFQDPQFGIFTLDRSFNHYSCGTLCNGSQWALPSQQRSRTIFRPL